MADYQEHGILGTNLATQLSSSALLQYLRDILQAKKDAFDSHAQEQQNDAYMKQLKYVLLSAHGPTLSAFLAGVHQRLGEYPP